MYKAKENVANIVTICEIIVVISIGVKICKVVCSVYFVGKVVRIIIIIIIVIRLRTTYVLW